jgi:hypothetical protein
LNVCLVHSILESLPTGHPHERELRLKPLDELCPHPLRLGRHPGMRGEEWVERSGGVELPLEDDPAGDGVEAHLVNGGSAVQVMMVVTVPADALGATLERMSGLVAPRGDL